MDVIMVADPSGELVGARDDRSPGHDRRKDAQLLLDTALIASCVLDGVHAGTLTDAEARARS